MLLRIAPFLFTSLIPCLCFAEIPWPGKTGPSVNGTCTGSLPLRWDEASNLNVAWKTKLEGFGHSTPVIGAGKVWMTSATEDGKKQFVYCLDAQTGEVLHHKLLFQNDDPEKLNNPINNYAAPTCVLENDAVYVHFGTYGTARLNTADAELQWQRRDIHARHFRGPGSSPVVFGDLLYLTFDGIDQQFVTALNKNTGETVWLTRRSTDYHDLGPDGKPKREGDMRKAYGTPLVVKVGQQHQLISVGSMAAFGYDALSGTELWTITHDDMNASAQPIAYRDTTIINTGGRGSNLISVRLANDMKGNVESSHIQWDRRKGNSRMSFPVLATPQRIAMVTDTGVVTCVEAESGEVVWTGRIGGNHIASPIVAGPYIYFFSIEGECTVVQADSDSFSIVQRNKLDEGMRSSPAAGYGALFLRTHGHLYKIASNE